MGTRKGKRGPALVRAPLNEAEDRERWPVRTSPNQERKSARQRSKGRDGLEVKPPSPIYPRVRVAVSASATTPWSIGDRRSCLWGFKSVTERGKWPVVSCAFDAAFICTRYISAGLVFLDLPIPAKRRSVRRIWRIQLLRPCAADPQISSYRRADNAASIHEYDRIACDKSVSCYCQTDPVKAGLTCLHCGRGSATATSPLKNFSGIVCCRRNSPFHRSLER